MRTLNIGAMGLMLAACGGKDDICETNPTDPSCPVDCVANPTDPRCVAGGTTYVTPPPACVEVARFSMDFSYGWNDTTGMTATVTIDGNAQPSLVIVDYGPDEWLGTTGIRGTCYQVFDVDGLTRAQACVDDATCVNGFDFNLSAAPIVDTCVDEMAANNVCATFEAKSGGVRATNFKMRAYEGPVDASIASSFSSIDSANLWRATADLGIADPVEAASFGWLVDQDMVVIDGSTPDVPAATMKTANGQVSAAYRITPPWVIFLQ